MYFCDSGVLCHLLSIEDEQDLQNSPQKGLIMESFVCSELLKHIAYSPRRIQLYHYRTTDQREIDFVLEYKQKLIGIEVKASKTVNMASFKHIIDFMTKNDRVTMGIVFYLGERIIHFGENLVAMPMTFFG